MDSIAAALGDFNTWLNDLVWGPWFMALLVGVGLYLTFRLRFFQIFGLRFAWRHTIGLIFKDTRSHERGPLSAFQAAAAAMAATIGVGNIAGVATAIAVGGPGAVFWMWMVALVGMATKFAEASLGLKFRHVDENGHVSGGAFYYIERGLGWRWLALVYALAAGFASFGIGNMVQANTMAHALATGFSVPDWATGLAGAFFTGIVILGGVKRIGAAASRIVPFMAAAYCAAALIVVVVNLPALPGVFASIFAHAFHPAEAAGGFAGATVWQAMRYGIARGVFSNEAGLGSASIVHAQARNTPGGQGLWGMWEVFLDTIVIGTMTALAILVSGALETGADGAALAANAFTEALPGAGGIIVLLALVLFSYTTLLTWSFYGEKSFEYLAGSRAILPYRLVFLVLIPVGAMGGLQHVWALADTLNGFMALPNLIALAALGGVVARERAALLGAARRLGSD